MPATLVSQLHTFADANTGEMADILHAAADIIERNDKLLSDAADTLQRNIDAYAHQKAQINQLSEQLKAANDNLHTLAGTHAQEMEAVRTQLKEATDMVTTETAARAVAQTRLEELEREKLALEQNAQSREEQYNLQLHALETKIEELRNQLKSAVD